MLNALQWLFVVGASCFPIAFCIWCLSFQLNEKAEWVMHKNAWLADLFVAIGVVLLIIWAWLAL